MTDYAELRAAAEAVKPGDSDTILTYILVSGPEVIRALLAERDALRDALKTIKDWPVTSPLNMDAHNMAIAAHAALAQEQEEA